MFTSGKLSEPWVQLFKKTVNYVFSLNTYF